MLPLSSSALPGTPVWFQQHLPWAPGPDVFWPPCGACSLRQCAAHPLCLVASASVLLPGLSFLVFIYIRPPWPHHSCSCCPRSACEVKLTSPQEP